MMMKKRLLDLALIFISCTPFFTYAAGLPWYVGGSVHGTQLSPNTNNSGFTLDNDLSFGGGAFLGFDLTTRFSAELGYHYLGEAKLSNDAGPAEISYSAGSAGILFYFLGDPRDIADRDGFVGYARLGVNFMNNEHTIPITRSSEQSLWIGVGLELPVTQKINLRAELASFDGDAYAATVSFLYRFRENHAATTGALPPYQAHAPLPSRIPVPTSNQAPAESPLVIEPRLSHNSTTTTGEVVQLPATDGYTLTENDNCLAPAANEPTRADGCALFSGLLAGVDFASGTAQLTPVATQRLDLLGRQLMQNPQVVIEISAHTEAFDGPATAKRIAVARTKAIASHLVRRGVPVSRLRARAYGSAKPKSGNTTASGRDFNNRIELRVLP